MAIQKTQIVPRTTVEIINAYNVITDICVRKDGHALVTVGAFESKDAADSGVRPFKSKHCSVELGSNKDEWTVANCYIELMKLAEFSTGTMV